MTASRFILARDLILAIGLFVATGSHGPAVAQTLLPNAPPYERELLRLAEIMGALHHLDPLCAETDTPTPNWRGRMNALIDAEASDELRRRRLVAAFNAGYRGLATAHLSCTTVARAALNGYVEEAQDLTAALRNRFSG